MRVGLVGLAPALVLVMVLVTVVVAGAADAPVVPPLQPSLMLPAPLPARHLRTLVHDPGGYDPARGPGGEDLLLGDLLFHSPRTLGPAAQALGLSCQTCHPNGATHRTLVLPDGLSDRPGSVDLTTGHFRAGADNRQPDFVNIPSLRGARFTGPYGRDGRTASLAEFVAGVVEGEFGGAPLAPTELRALVRYVQDLDFLPNARLDTHGRLVPVAGAAGAAAGRGEALFAAPRAGFAGGSCATCHLPSSFFRDGRVHRLGSATPPAAAPHGLDDGFETPTLLGLAETAPYFHDGRFATLAGVVAWFDTTFALRLSPRARADLVAYLEAVGAVDRATDDRPLPRQMSETFVYLGLLLDGDARDDRRVWGAAVELVRAEMAGRAPPPPAVALAVPTIDRRLAALAAHAAAGEPLAPLRPVARDLRRALLRLAADWAGAASGATAGGPTP